MSLIRPLSFSIKDVNSLVLTTSLSCKSLLLGKISPALFISRVENIIFYQLGICYLLNPYNQLDYDYSNHHYYNLDIECQIYCAKCLFHYQLHGNFLSQHFYHMLMEPLKYEGSHVELLPQHHQK